MPFPLIPVIMAAASLAGSLIASRSQKKQAERTAKANIDLQNLAFEQNQAAIDKQNLYNTPANQMGRFLSAGLNPNLIYGQGAAGGGNQSQAARYEAPTVDLRFQPASIMPALGAYQDFSMKQAQIDNVKAQTAETHSKIMTEAIRQHVMKIQGKTGEFDLKRREYLAPYEAAITGNKARSSEANLQQEWKRLELMSQEQQMNVLNQQYKEKAMTAVDLDNEKREADIIYKKYQNQWAKAGITSSDNILFRILVRMILDSGFQGDISNILPK